MIGAEKTFDTLLKRTGIDFKLINSETGTAWRAAQFERNKGFRVEMVETTAQKLLQFSLENFAADLARSIRTQFADNLRSLTATESQKSSSMLFELIINGTTYRDFDKPLEVVDWKNISIRVWINKPYDSTLLDSAGQFLLAIILLILPLDEGEDELDLSGAFEIEGDARKGAVTRYERSRKNRQICLAVHGYDCSICGVNLEDKYGNVAHEFIHVHHITPVSRMKEPGPVNPVNELIPVCPNCHYVMHRTDPPLHPDDLKAQLH